MVCIAQKEGLELYASREFNVNTCALSVNYKCSLRGYNKQGSLTAILKSASRVKFYIKAEATTRAPTRKIISADAYEVSFKPVGSYFITNINLAAFKAN